MDLTIGEYVIIQRRRLGLTQLQLAQRAGLSMATPGALEHDDENSTLHTIKAIAGALGCVVEIDMKASKQVLLRPETTQMDKLPNVP